MPLKYWQKATREQHFALFMMPFDYDIPVMMMMTNMHIKDR